MTFVTLLTSWEFWLVNTVFCSMAWFFGYITQGFLTFNDPKVEGCQRLHADEYGVELIELRAEGRRLQEQADALRIVNEDLQDQLDDMDKGEGIEPDDLLPELLRRETEHKPGPEQAV